MDAFFASLRLVLVTMAICVAGYGTTIWSLAQILTPGSAEGSLIRTADGTVIGSRLIAQQFTEPQYFWSRPSAVDYNASAAGGSNKSPTSTELAKRAEEIMPRYDATAANPLPPELAADVGLRPRSAYQC